MRLIIFDEVQEFPRAHQLVKYFVKYGKYPIVETGSLISMKMKTKGTLPSEIKKVSMNPMDFEEFMWATSRDVQMRMIRDSFMNNEPLDEALHQVMMETFRIYMMVGGMPQSISTLIETNNFSEVEEVKKTILYLYRSDINREDDGILMELFNSIPPMLNRVSKAFSPNVVKNGSKSGRYIKRISWLCESKMVNPCYNSTSPDPTIIQFEDRGNLKLYFFDTGLLMTMMMEKNMATHEDLYRGILSGNLSMNQGMLFENMVAQMFVSTGKMLDFCLFRSDESDRIQELDFLLMDGRSMIPIEVKSSRVNPHKSIDRFVKKYGDRVGKGYIICTKNLSNDSGLTILPIYMAGLI